DGPYWVLKNGENDLKNTFANDVPSTNNDDNADEHSVTQERAVQERLIKIQSMLHVSYPSNTYKVWLYETLNYIWQNKTDLTNTDLSVFGEGLLKKLESFPRNKFNEHVNTANNLPKTVGLGIPRIVFYYTDYLLWKLYFEN